MLPVIKRPASAAVQDASLPLDRTTLRKFTQGQSRAAGTWLAVPQSSGGHPPFALLPRPPYLTALRIQHRHRLLAFVEIATL
jgi:hypothetical protein